MNGFENNNCFNPEDYQRNIRISYTEKMQHQKSLENNILTWEELEPVIGEHFIFKNEARERVWKKWVWRQVVDEGLSQYNDLQEKFLVVCRFMTVCQILYEFSEVYYCNNYNVNYDNLMSNEFLEELDLSVFSIDKEKAGIDDELTNNMLVEARDDIHKLLMKKHSIECSYTTAGEILSGMASVLYESGNLEIGDEYLSFEDFFLQRENPDIYEHVEYEHYDQTIQWILNGFFFY